MPTTHTVTLYRITASYARDGQTIDCTQAEVLGDAYGVTYPDRSSAEAAAEELQSDVEPVEHDLDASTTYSVVEYPIQVYGIETSPSDGSVEVTAEVLCADYQGSTVWTTQPRDAGAGRVDGLEPAGSSIDAWVDSDIARRLTADARALVGTPAAFGDRKVFLSALLGPVAGQDMSELDELRAWGLITFARADLVAAMDPAMVAASEWDVGGAIYHFLVLPGPRGDAPNRG